MLYLSFILFIALFLIILFGAHFFVFRLFFRAFSLAGSHSKYIAIILSVALPVSFFLASFLAHLSENVVTRAVYFLSAVWLGIFVNLFLAAVIIRALSFIMRIFNTRFGFSQIASIAVGIALLVSAYGVWNAFHPAVRYISVTIPNLPEAWQGKTIVQLSDVHLGHIYRAGYLQGVVDRVNALHPEAVMITGDLFDGMDGDLWNISKPLGNLRSTYGTYFITGNHETYLGVDRALSALDGTGVRVLDDETADIGGITLVGISYPDPGKEKDISALLETFRTQLEGKPSILLSHAPTEISEIAQSGINLQLSGHTHRGQQFPFQLITFFVHKGYDYGLYRIGDFSLYVSSGVGTWGPPMRVGTQSEIVAITIK